MLDPFGGFGSTLISCEKTGRQARLIELDPKYCDVICRRWQDFTGKERFARAKTTGVERPPRCCERNAERLGQVQIPQK